MAKREPDAILGRILVVDDNEMNRDMLSRRLARRGHTVDVADGGARALELLSGPGAGLEYDLVLLDIMMPDVDGMTVLDQVRTHTDAQRLPIIMATAKTESEDIVDALKRGANDYVTKPLDFPVVLARVRTQLALKRAYDELAAAHAKMKGDLDAAARCQQALLPKTSPDCPSVEVAWRYRPCDELGGDALGVHMLDDATLAVFLLDASGHGVPASLLSVAAVRALSPGDAGHSIVIDWDGDTARPVEPAVVAARLNNMFPMSDNGGHYFTLIYGLLNVRTGLFRFVSPGAPGPLYLAEHADPQAVDAPGLPIGMGGDLPADHALNDWYDLAEIQLAPGDRVLLYSDGVNEEHGHGNDQQFGRERLIQANRDAPETLDQHLDGLLAQLTEWHGSAQFSDDVSLLTVRWLGT